MARGLTLWRVESVAIPKKTAATTATATTDGTYLPLTRMGDIPVFVRSVYDNPELFYADPQPLLVRWPVPSVGDGLPFQNPPLLDKHRDFSPRVRSAREVGPAYQMPAVIFELPYSVVDPPLRKENWDDYNPLRIYRLRQSHIAARAEQTHQNPWDIPGSAWGVSSCELLAEIQRHFLEPVVDDGLSWQLWTAAEVRAFLNLRIQRFLLETGITRKESTVEVEEGQSLVELPTDLLEIRKVDFYDGSRFYSLNKIDELQADSGNPGWEDSSNYPESYVEEPLVSLNIKLCPSPSSAGTLYIRYVPLPETVTSSCTLLPIPRMFSWAVKWGVIADLLMKEGEANDPVRAVAAEGQFTLGVNLARYLSGVEI